MEKGKEETQLRGGSAPSATLAVEAQKIEADIERLRESLRTGDKRKERIAELLADLRAGRRVTDFRFDEIFPRAMRELSEIHWTPVEVAARAASLLSAGSNTRILDVGSGCGKFCLIGALTTSGLFFGVEQREVLINIAKATRELLDIRRVAFAHGNMSFLDWSTFDAFYLYNPFYEHQVDRIRIDESLNYSEEIFDEYARIVTVKLSKLKIGTRVVTYHGFGGRFPPGYKKILAEPAVSGFLELWEKAMETPSGWIMIGDRNL